MNRRRIFLGLTILAMLIVWRTFFATKPEEDKTVHITGTTMGVITYSIKYLDDDKRDFNAEVDSILFAFNDALSTYIPSSEISRFNKSDSIEFESPFFHPVLAASLEVFENSGGAFDPTVGPLVNAWGFGTDKEARMDSSQVDSLRELIGFEKIIFDTSKARKSPSMYLNLSAIAKGNAIDVVASFLESKSIQNYMVEIGGELVCKGKTNTDTLWVIAIEKPSMNRGRRETFARVSIENRALATSGNYRNYYDEGGKIISHTINPFTGYPASHNLLSASIFAENCTLADGYATACMVLGVEKSIELVERINGLEAFFIYSNEEGEFESYATDGIASYIEVVD